MVRAGPFVKVTSEPRSEEGKGTSRVWGGAFQLEGLASSWSRGRSRKSTGEESGWALGSEEALNGKKWKDMGWFKQRSDQV